MTYLYEKVFILFQYLLPHHSVSRLAGLFGKSRCRFIKNFFIRWFVNRYKVDMSQAAEPDPLAYESFNAFFTRALLENARPIDLNESGVVSPVDGSISQIGEIRSDLLFQAKSFNYSLESLLGGTMLRADPFLNGKFATFYLSPKDYHRVHMPVAGTLREMVYIPGHLFSVNPLTVSSVPNLFARNERVVCVFETAIGPIAVVLIGAMIVRSIQTVWAGIVTPPHRGKIKIWKYPHEGANSVYLEKGAELGRFQTGSTVIVLFGAKHVNFVKHFCEASLVKVGELLGFSADSITPPS